MVQDTFSLTLSSPDAAGWPYLEFLSRIGGCDSEMTAHYSKGSNFQLEA